MEPCNLCPKWHHNLDFCMAGYAIVWECEIRQLIKAGLIEIRNRVEMKFQSQNKMEGRHA